MSKTKSRSRSTGTKSTSNDSNKSHIGSLARKSAITKATKTKRHRPKKPRISSAKRLAADYWPGYHAGDQKKVKEEISNALIRHAHDGTPFRFPGEPKMSREKQALLARQVKLKLTRDWVQNQAHSEGWSKKTVRELVDRLHLDKENLTSPSFANMSDGAIAIVDYMRTQPLVSDLANGRWCDVKDAEGFEVDLEDWLADRARRLEVHESVKVPPPRLELAEDDMKALGLELTKMRLGRRKRTRRSQLTKST